MEKNIDKNRIKNEIFDYLSRLILGYGGFTAGDILSKNINKHISKKILPNLSNKPSSKINKKFIDFFTKKHKIGRLKIKQGVINHYDPFTKEIRLRNFNSVPVLAHELGHVADFKKFNKLKYHLRTKTPIVGLLGAKGLLFSTDKDAAKYAPAVYFAGHLPVLYQEGKASVIGRKAIKDFFGSAKARSANKHLAYAFLSYLVKGLLPAAGLYAANKISDNINEKSRKFI